MVSANEIVPGLWLGNIRASRDENFFQRAGIRAVVNAANDGESPFADKGVQYFHVPVDDPGPGVDPSDENIVIMTATLPQVVEWIFEHRRRGHPVLVHCHAGAQRSAAIVTAYLFSHAGVRLPGAGFTGGNPKRLPRSARAGKLQSVIGHIVKERPVAFFGGESVNFLESLRHYADV